jgi:hypothetical protein
MTVLHPSPNRACPPVLPSHFSHSPGSSMVPQSGEAGAGA